MHQVLEVRHCLNGGTDQEYTGEIPVCDFLWTLIIEVPLKMRHYIRPLISAQGQQSPTWSPDSSFP